jgi:hypothetical protein
MYYLNPVYMYFDSEVIFLNRLNFRPVKPVLSILVQELVSCSFWDDPYFFSSGLIVQC